MTATPTDTPTRMDVSAVLRKSPIIAVLRASEPRDYDAIIEALIENGVRSIELTLSTPGTLEHLPSLVARAFDGEIGVGTVTTLEQARSAIDGGASYLVTPVVKLDVIELAVGRGVPVYAGGLTPSELHSAWEAGASAVKIFPAETVGPQYGAHLRGPFPDLQFIPSGGVGIDDIADWLRAGAVAVSMGGPLLGDALRGGSLTGLAERSRRVLEIAASVERDR